MSDRAAYSRVYWSVMDDPKFDSVRGDVRLVGSWTLMLIVADMAHPAPAYVPSPIPRACVRALVEAGLVDELAGGMFRIHGLAAERGRRRESATRSGPNGTPSGSGIRTQQGPNRDPNGEQDETRRDKTSKDETSNARESLNGYDGRADLEAFLLVARRAPTARQRQLLDSLLLVHDLNGPQWAADIILAHPNDPIGAVIEADKTYRSERIEAARSQEHKPTPVRRKPSLPESTRELLEHWKQSAKPENEVPA